MTQGWDVHTGYRIFVTANETEKKTVIEDTPATAVLRSPHAAYLVCHRSPWQTDLSPPPEETAPVSAPTVLHHEVTAQLLVAATFVQYTAVRVHTAVVSCTFSVRSRFYRLRCGILSISTRIIRVAASGSQIRPYCATSTAIPLRVHERSHRLPYL